jgi:hypothetical protein
MVSYPNCPTAKSMYLEADSSGNINDVHLDKQYTYMSGFGSINSDDKKKDNNLEDSHLLFKYVCDKYHDSSTNANYHCNELQKMLTECCVTTMDGKKHFSSSDYYHINRKHHIRYLSNILNQEMTQSFINSSNKN